MHIKKIKFMIEELKDGIKDSWYSIRKAEELPEGDKLRKYFIDKAKTRLGMFEEDMEIYKNLCREHIDKYKEKEKEKEMEMKDSYTLMKCHEMDIENDYRELKFKLSLIKQ